MEIIFLVLVIVAYCCWQKIAVFESTFAALLLLPIATFFLAHLFGPSAILYYCSLLVFLVLLTFVCKRFRSTTYSYNYQHELTPIAVWVICYSYFNYLCLSWPDFYQLGERLRDYALLSSVINSPLVAQEPWQSGANLNYYLYWYRFGHILSSLFNFPTWSTYHNLQSFTYALFGTSIFVILYRNAKFNLISACLCTALITLGSNIEGIKHFLTGDNNWWGPSRVIPGAIDEFPAWSFLLGDAHPHYLNLSLIPFLVCIFLRSSSYFNKAMSLTAYLILFMTSGVLWVYNANAWEAPVWLLLCGLTFTALLLGNSRNSINQIFKHDPGFEALFKPEMLLILAAGILLCCSLIFSALNITPAEMPLKVVTQEIGRTSLGAFMRHWGFAIGLIIISTILCCRHAAWIFIVTLSVTIAAFLDQAVYLLCVLLTLTFARLILQYRDKDFQQNPIGAVFESFGLAALLLITFPEFYYLDDSYGGDIERMNTIFKAYSASWAFLHLHAFWQISKLKDIYSNKINFYQFSHYGNLALALIATINCAFFFKTIQLRKHSPTFVEPRAQGLSEVERRFPGSAETIKILIAKKPGVVLEAQGPAYDFTTHVATLAGKTSYLGWVNHVNLLNRDYNETARRTQMTDNIYRETNCQNKLNLSKQEGISYVVFGPLERKAYPEIKVEDFSCFKQIAKSKEYYLFGVL